MRHDAGPKIDWLHTLPDKFRDEQGQKFLGWLKHLEANYHDIYDHGDPSWIDTIAPYLAKEYSGGNIEPNRHPAAGQDDPNVYKGDYASPHLYPQDSLQEKIPSWAELLQSRKAPRNYMDPDFHIGRMDASRQDWDDEHSPDRWANIYNLEDLREFEEAQKQRQHELQNPDRHDTQPITPGYSWPDLVSEAHGNRYANPDPDDIDYLYQHAKEAGQIPELAKHFEEYAADHESRANDDLNDNYVTPSGEELGIEEPEPGAGTPEWEDWYNRNQDTFDLDRHEHESQWRAQDPVLQGIDQMYELLQPHYDPFSGGYTNEGPVQQNIEGIEPGRVPGEPVKAPEQAPRIPQEQGRLVDPRPAPYRRHGPVNPDTLPQFSPQQLERANEIRREHGYDTPFNNNPESAAARMQRHIRLIPGGDLHIPPHERQENGLPLNGGGEGHWGEGNWGDYGGRRVRMMRWQLADEIGHPAIPPANADPNRDDAWIYNQEVQAKTATTITPLYYRWAFDPTSGETNLSHNQEGHPAYIKTHRELGKPEDYHGYAYRIDGGWRLTDYGHRPVDDPYVVAQVMRALNGSDGLRMASTGWERLPENWDRLHYGLPI